MYTIATLHDLRRHLNLTANDNDGDDDLLRALQDASHLIEALTQRRYCPRLESRAVSLDPANPHELFLPDDLLELKSISDEGGGINLAEIRLLPSHADSPASVLQRTDGASFSFSVSPSNSVSIDGVWGWHDRWSQAWRDSRDTIRDLSLSAAETVLTVDDSDGSDQDGLSPRFHIGHLLRIEDEYLRVTAVDHTANQLTVLRGVRGTEAASHARGAKIETYAPPPAIRDLTLRYAELMIKSVGLLDEASTPLLERMRRLTA